jgi:transaldolase/glucose-6-phosphate isomerase
MLTGDFQMNPIQRLEACGQSPWLDFLKRSFVTSGSLRGLIESDGLKGLTSNPSIFEKAIGESDEYAGAIEEFLHNGDRDVAELYDHLVIADIRAAADEFMPVYERTGGRDGYVSLECPPRLANEAEATVKEGLRLWELVARPNLMVKVPATEAGIPAIRALIGKGVNVNITLLFSVTVYEKVVESYLEGLELLREIGGDLSRVASVASFFISRIDTAVDKKLDAKNFEEPADRETAARLRGKTAIANAKLAYEHYGRTFSTPRWKTLADKGARTQRLLWASTSAKDPAFKDTKYVEALIGRDTVDTMPPETMDAFRDHGEVEADGVAHDIEGARATLAELRKLGVSFDAITAELVEDGVRQFADAFDKLDDVLTRRRQAIIDSRPDGRQRRSG